MDSAKARKFAEMARAEGYSDDEIIAKLKTLKIPKQKTNDVSISSMIGNAGKNAFNTASEFAAANNRSVAGFLDFVGPDTVNAAMNVAGSDMRVPTFTDKLNKHGGRGGFMEEGIYRDVTQGLGSLLPAAMGMKSVGGRDLATATGAATEFLGLGSAKIVDPLVRAVPTAIDAIQNSIPTQAKRAALLPLLRQSGGVAAAGFKLDDAARVVKDKAQRTAMSAGVDEGTVAMISASNPSTKSRMGQMVDYLEKGRNNLEFRNFNPPVKILGQSIDDRLKVILHVNRQAGEAIDVVAETLKGKPINVDKAISEFVGSLKKEGIKFNFGDGSLNFKGSSIEGLNKAQGIIRRVVNRLYDTESPTKNAHNAHLAKRFIDEQVTFGKSPDGLSGKMSTIVKSLRHGIDESLDTAFPEYDKVNTTYKETRDVIDELQSLAGKKVDLTGSNADKALGTMSRKVLSNYSSGTATEDMLKVLDDVAIKYNTGEIFEDELPKLISMEAEIRRMFPSAIKPNTLQGEIGTEFSRAAGDMATGNNLGLYKGLAKAAGKLFSKDDEAKIKAIKDMLDN